MTVNDPGSVIIRKVGAGKQALVSLTLTGSGENAIEQHLAPSAAIDAAEALIATANAITCGLPQEGNHND